MKLLLDECTPRRLRREFVGHDVFTVDDVKLKGFKNGRLLRAVAGNYDVLITVDRNIPYQQNASSLGIANLILAAKSNRYTDLQLLVPQALEALKTIQKGEIVRVES
jgi:hypothetical protein